MVKKFLLFTEIFSLYYVKFLGNKVNLVVVTNMRIEIDLLN